jgi:large subunit ribosomal protein L33
MGIGPACSAIIGTAQGRIMKVKERYVFLECTNCSNRNYTTHKRLKATYKLEKKKFCRFCRQHTAHKEKKL